MRYKRLSCAASLVAAWRRIDRSTLIDKVDETMLPRVGIITTDLQATTAAIENVAGPQQVVLLGRRR